MSLLITSIGRRSYMIDYFKEYLKADESIHAINSELTYALTQADHYAISPGIYEENYISFVIDYCKANNINKVISLFDIDLPILSKHKSLFSAHDIYLIISDYELIEICNDKWKSYQFLIENHFNTPKTFIDLDVVKTELRSGNLSFPLIIKPRWGMGSIGIHVVDDIVELDVLYAKTMKTIQSTYLQFESNSAIEKSILIQEKINGEEIGLDVFNDLNGEYLVTVPKLKISMRAGETDVAKVINDADLVALGKSISSITKHIGNLDVDVFKASGQYYILEFNARFGGQYPFSHAAGVHFPKVILDQLYCHEINSEDLFFHETLAYKDIKINVQ